MKKTISDYAELYREATTSTLMPISNIMAGLGIKDPNDQKVLAQAMLKYMQDNGINQNNFSKKTFGFLAQQTGDADAVKLAMAQQQFADPNAFKDEIVKQPAINQQNVDTNGDGQVTTDEQLAQSLATALAGTWIAKQQQNPDTSIAAKNVVASINRVLADLKVTIPAESKLLLTIQQNLHNIPNYKQSPYWNKVDQEITSLLSQAK